MSREARWRRRGVPLVLAMGVLLAAARPAVAQLPIEVWVRPVGGIPVGAFAGRDDGIEARASLGYDAGASLSLGALTLYGEYQEIDFSCGECAEVGVAESVLDRGWGAGAIVPYPARWGGFRPWARVGVVGHHLRFRFQDEMAYTEPALGWSLGFGAEATPLRWLRIEPSLMYRSYDAQRGFSIDVPDRRTSISYIVVGLGIGVAL